MTSGDRTGRRARFPSTAAAGVLVVAGLCTSFVWLTSTFDAVEIRWSDDSLSDECRFLSPATRDALRDARVGPLVAMAASVLALGALSTLVARRRIQPKVDGTGVGRTLMANAVLGAVLLPAAYTPSWEFYGAAFAALVAALASAAWLHAIRATAELWWRPPILGWWGLCVVFVAAVPFAVATATDVGESFVCMS